MQTHGKLKLAEVLSPAINMASHGFVLGPVTAQQWTDGTLQGAEALKVFRPHGRSPRVGETITNVDLANTFCELAEKGAAQGFYSGRIAESIVAAAGEMGGAA